MSTRSEWANMIQSWPVLGLGDKKKVWIVASLSRDDDDPYYEDIYGIFDNEELAVLMHKRAIADHPFNRIACDWVILNDYNP